MFTYCIVSNTIINERRFTVTKTLNVIEDVLIGAGLWFSIENIKEWLGLALLGFQVMLILIKVVAKVIQHFKDKKYSEVVKTIEETQSELTNVTNSFNESKSTHD